MGKRMVKKGAENKGHGSWDGGRPNLIELRCAILELCLLCSLTRRFLHLYEVSVLRRTRGNWGGASPREDGEIGFVRWSRTD
jgi:hypothetical protein